MGAPTAFRLRRRHQATFPTKSNSFHPTKPKEKEVGFYAAAEKMHPPTAFSKKNAGTGGRFVLVGRAGEAVKEGGTK